jgi:hypothetical protein
MNETIVGPNIMVGCPAQGEWHVARKCCWSKPAWRCRNGVVYLVVAHMKRLVLALVLAVVACSSPSTAPSPPALAGDLPVFQYGLYDAHGNNQQLVGGFLHFPGGAFHRDAGADMVRDYSGDRYIPLTRTTVQPYLFGAGEGDLGQTTYDAASARWLPVARHQVSDDGLRYAYRELLRGDPNAIGDQPPREVRFHVVDVRTGSDQVVYVTNGTPPLVIAGFSGQAIWLTRCGNEASGCWGSLWRLDTATGTVSKVSERRGRWVISGGSAWTVVCSSPRYAPGDTSSPPADTCLMGLADSKPDQLLRVDLTTGNDETWDREPGIVLLGIGPDGLPVLKLNRGGQSTLLRVTQRGHTERLFALPIDKLNSGGGFEGPLVADKTGIWLPVVDGGPQPRDASPAMAVGIYMYSKSSGMRKVSDFPGVPVGILG